MKVDEFATSEMKADAAAAIPDLILPQRGDKIEIPLDEELTFNEFTVPAGTRITCILQNGAKRARWTGLNWIFLVEIQPEMAKAPDVFWITAVTSCVWERVEP